MNVSGRHLNPFVVAGLADWRVAAVLLLVSLFQPAPAAAHPFHVTVGEASWNAESRLLEVALKVPPAELERALRRRTRRRVSLESTPAIGRLARDYVRETLVFKTASGTTVPPRWIGHEVSLKEAWLYFEIDLPAGPDRIRITNRMFFELHKEQVNTINFRVGEARQSLVFSRDNSKGQLRLDPKRVNRP